MNKFRVLVTRSLPRQSIQIFKSVPNIECIINEQLPLSKSRLIELINGCDALFCTLNDKIDKEVIEQAGPNLKVIATCSVGHEHIDLKECQKRNIRVGYTPGVLDGKYEKIKDSCQF